MRDFPINIGLNTVMKKLSGFTLFELLAVIAITGVLIGIGMPALQQFIKNNRLIMIHNELVSALQVSRSSAIKGAGSACVCSSATASSASPSCSGSNSWEQGWIAFIDTNTTATNTCVYDATDGDILLKAWDGVPYGNQITVRSASATVNAADYVQFNSRGVPLSSTGASLQGMFKVCDDRGLSSDGVVLARGIILSASGSVRMTRDTTQIVACL